MLIIWLFAFFISFTVADGDAYLSQSDIYYGADSYQINYEKEIITAEGHAFFKKDSKLLTANKIVIYYSKDISMAKGFGNVRLRDNYDGSSISSNYGEAHFNENLYLLKGRVRYRRENIKVLSDSMKVYRSSENQDIYEFSGSCIFNNENYRIESEELTVKGDTAVFTGSVRVDSVDGHEKIRGGKLVYNMDSGDTAVTGDVIYENFKEKFILIGDYLNFIKSANTTYVIGNAFLITDNYSIGSETMTFDADQSIFKASGNVVVISENVVTRCDSYTLNRREKRSDFLFDVRGKIEQKGVQ